MPFATAAAWRKMEHWDTVWLNSTKHTKDIKDRKLWGVSLGRGHRDTKDGVGAKLALVGSTIEPQVRIGQGIPPTQLMAMRPAGQSRVTFRTCHDISVHRQLRSSIILSSSSFCLDTSKPCKCTGSLASWNRCTAKATWPSGMRSGRCSQTRQPSEP